MRYFIELAYKGTNYHGWQVQPNAVTVQVLLDDALNKVIRNENIHIVGAGRTDTGVHASYFVAHIDVLTRIDDTVRLVNKLNRILPNDIVVYTANEVADDTHSRFSAVERTYRYNVQTGRNPFNLDLVHQLSSTPDFDKMNEAASILLEYVDFTSFSKLHTDVKTNNCKVSHAQWTQNGDRWVFTITADRFLRNMVRAVVGTLLDVGRGKMSVDDFRKVIEAKDRGAAGVSASPQGLFLADIVYPGKLFARSVDDMLFPSS